MTEETTSIRRPQRWDVPYWRENADAAASEMTSAEVEELLATHPFKEMEPSRFPASTPLREILRHDARI